MRPVLGNLYFIVPFIFFCIALWILMLLGVYSGLIVFSWDKKKRQAVHVPVWTRERYPVEPAGSQDNIVDDVIASLTDMGHKPEKAGAMLDKALARVGTNYDFHSLLKAALKK